MPLIQQISKLRPALAEAAQKVIDEWVQDEEGFNEDLGSGGACDEVARALESVIGSAMDEVDILDGGQDGDDHAWLIVVDDAEAAGVDIHPSVYETGGGYSWKKRQDAKVAPDDISIWEIDRRDIAERVASRIAIKIPPKTVYLGQFSYLGRTYDVKVRDNGQAAVVYQKSPKCVFGKDENGWYFHGGSRAIYEAAVRHLDSLGVLSKTASGSSDKMRLQEGAGFHLQPDGTWEVKDVPPAVAQDARFSGFLAIEGYWCAVFELNGEEWAQKAGPGVGSGAGPVAARIADIARRVALSPEIHLS